MAVTEKWSYFVRVLPTFLTNLLLLIWKEQSEV